MSNIADLHMHSTKSDGQSEPSEVISAAKEVGLDFIALTDHDTYHRFGSPVVERQGIKVISGMELRVEPSSMDERVDLLAYGVTTTDQLESLVEQVRTNRKVRAQEMIDRIEEKTGCILEYEPNVSTGRPDIARAVVKNDNLDYSYSECFQKLIGHGDYCYVSRDIPSFEKGVKVLNESSMYISLAHPYRYENSHQAIRLAKNLDAVECYYEYGSKIQTDDFADEFVEENGLGKTGGSDAHRVNRIGSSGLDQDLFNDFADDSGIVEYL